MDELNDTLSVERKHTAAMNRANAARRKATETTCKAEEERKAAEVQPTHYSLEEFQNIDWNATLGELAQESHVKDGEILDSWEQIFEAIDSGDYKKIYKIGDCKLLDLGPEGQVHMQIAAFDADDRADGKGKAPITWISRELLKTERRMNFKYREDGFIFKKPVPGTGGIGGWEQCELRGALQNEIMPLLPKTVVKRILPAKRGKWAVNLQKDLYVQVTEDRLWIPSYEELATGKYGDLFANEEKRVKKKPGSASGAQWWLCSARKPEAFIACDSDGIFAEMYAECSGGVALGLCT